LKSDCQLYCN